MEAQDWKDTVMKTDVYTYPQTYEHYKVMLEQQAEISYKVGEKKVIDFLAKKYSKDLYYVGLFQVVMPLEDWLDFRKSEGIE